jgi:hypothetical protein
MTRIFDSSRGFAERNHHALTLAFEILTVSSDCFVMFQTILSVKLQRIEKTPASYPTCVERQQMLEIPLSIVEELPIV